MAELSYHDVRRAVQEEVRNLQVVVNELRSSHEDIRRHMQQSYTTQQSLQAMMNRVNAIQQQITTLSNLTQNTSSASAVASVTQQLLQQVYQVNRRLDAIEDMCREINVALGRPARQQEEPPEEQQQYQAA